MEYTYTILHKPSGKKYHGSKYAKDADPEQLFNLSHSSPYFTSSSIVHKLIEEDGIDSFEILNITEYAEDGLALKAEQKLLKQLLCDEPENWLNRKHGCLSHDDPIFLQRMIDKYGVDHNMKIPEVVERIKATNLERYGHVCVLKSQRVVDIVFEKYGVANVFQHEEIKQKIRETNLERYGVENPTSLPEVIAKRKATWSEKFGEEIDSPFKNPEVAAKRAATWMAKYGLVWPARPESMNELMRKPKSEETKIKMSLAHKQRPFCSCLCCGIEIRAYQLTIHYNRKHSDESEKI